MEFFQDAHNWVMLSFLVFVIFAVKFGKGKAIAKIDARIARIRDDIRTAERLRAEAEEILNKYQTKQRDAAVEADTIVADARKAAEMIRNDAKRDLEEMMARKEQQLSDRLKRMEDTAKAEIQAYAAELAVKATKEIIVSRLDQAANDRLVEQSIRDVAGQLK